MNPTIHWHCVEARDPFLRAFRAEAAARYERLQAERRRGEFLELIRCRLAKAQASVVSRRGAP